jgi:hypothetical protein
MGLAKDLVAEPFSPFSRRFEADEQEAGRWPAHRVTPHFSSSGIRLVTRLRRLGDDQNTPHAQEWGTTFGRHRRRSEGPSHDDIEQATQQGVATGHFGSLADNRYSFRPGQVSDGFLQEGRPALVGIEEDDFGVYPPIDEQQTRKSSAGSEIEHGSRGTHTKPSLGCVRESECVDHLLLERARSEKTQLPRPLENFQQRR